MSLQSFAFDPALQHARPDQAKPGQIHVTPEGDVWQYCPANGASTAGELHQIAKDGSFDATPMTTTTVNSLVWGVGVPDIDVTDNYFAWYWRGNIVGGDFEIVLANAVGADSVLTSTATAGVGGTGGTPVDGLTNIDAGVTDTRVTCWANGILTVGKTAAYD